MSRKSEDVDIDFGLDTSPRQTARFIGVTFGAMAALGIAACALVYVTSPRNSDFGEIAASVGMPTLAGASVAIMSGGRVSASMLDSQMKEACRQMASMSAMLDNREMSSSENRRAAQACGD